MIKFDIVTIFPEVVNEYINVGIVNNARKNKLVEINVHDLHK